LRLFNTAIVNYGGKIKGLKKKMNIRSIAPALFKDGRVNVQGGEKFEKCLVSMEITSSLATKILVK